MRPSACSASAVAARAAAGGSPIASFSTQQCFSTLTATSRTSRISPPAQRPHPATSRPARRLKLAHRAPGVLAAASCLCREADAASERAPLHASPLNSSRPATQQRRSRSRKKTNSSGDIVRARAASPSVDASSSSSASGSSASGRDVSASASASAGALLGGPAGASPSTRRHGDVDDHGNSPSASTASTSTSSASTSSFEQEQDILLLDPDDPLVPRRPLLLRWLPDAETELRALSFSSNFLLIGVAAAAAAGGVASHSLGAAVSAAHAAAEAAEAAAHGGMHDPVTLDAVSLFSPFGLDLLSGSSAASLAEALGGPWRHFASLNEAHPFRVAAAISGTVYGLGDLTAQAYEGRGLRDLDAARLLRSSAAGALAHGPLSAVFYERLDRLVILSDAFGNGDAWFAPLFKVGVDQTLWAATWNALYLSLLGAMRLESPSVIRKSVASSGWDVLRAGWRLWPLVHLLTYTLIPLEARLLWVDAVDLGWVSVLAAYAAQRRGREEKKRQQRQRHGGKE